MWVRKDILVEERGSTVRWLLAQLWDERVLLAAVIFAAFLMWMGGIPAGWIAFVVMLLVLAGFARGERLEALAPTAVVPAQRAEADTAEGLDAIAALIDALDMPVLIVTADELVRNVEHLAPVHAYDRFPRCLIAVQAALNDLVGHLRWRRRVSRHHEQMIARMLAREAKSRKEGSRGMGA